MPLWASLYWSRNEVKEAGQAFKTAADLAPERSPARLRYADFLIKTGAGAEAKSFLEEMNRKAPDYLPPRVFLMKIACAEHQDEDCITRVQNVLSQDPINFDALFIDGMLSLSKGEAAKAIRVFEYLSNTYAEEFSGPISACPRLFALRQQRRRGGKPQGRGERRKPSRRSSQAQSAFRAGDPAAGRAQDQERRPCPRRGFARALDQGTAADCSGALPARHRLFGPTKEGRGLSGLPSDDRIIPERSSAAVPCGKHSFGARSAGGRAQGVREINRDLSGLSAAHRESWWTWTLPKSSMPPHWRGRKSRSRRTPKLAQAWALRGKIYFAQRDFAHAEADLLKAVELDPKLEPAYLLLGQLYVASNRQQEAIAKLSAFVEKNKTVQTIPAMMQLAMIQDQLKNFTASRDVYENVLSVAPNFPLALNNLAALYSEHLGQLDKAYDLAQKAREAVPNEPNIADTLGWILFKKGDYGNALRLLQQSSSKLPELA